MEANTGGGPSLYQAAGQHTSLGQESWPALRRYCHAKMGEWWQWYQPYYKFPLQVSVQLYTLLSRNANFNIICPFQDLRVLFGNTLPYLAGV